MLRALRISFKALVLFWAVGRWAFGYIDPNTGGMLFQILAILLAFSSAIILFFSRSIRTGVARVLRAIRSRSEK